MGGSVQRLLPWILALPLIVSHSGDSWASQSTVDSSQKSAVRKRRVRRSRRRRRRRLVQLRSGPGYQVRIPRRAWGTTLTVDGLQQVFTAYHAHFPGAPQVWIHDISSRYGGRLEPHLSHRTGRDVDIRLVLKRPLPYQARASGRTLNLEVTYFLIERLVATGSVEFIFLDRRLQRALYRYALRRGRTRAELSGLFQYPHRAQRGVVRHWKGHDDHMHVRFSHVRRRPQVALAY